MKISNPPLGVASVITANLADGAVTQVKMAYARCLLRNSVAIAVANGAGQPALTLDTEEYDTAALHSTAINTSRITIPAGFTLFRHGFCCSVNTIVALSVYQLIPFKNGLAFNTNGGVRIVPGGAADTLQLVYNSPWYVVAPGDFFELMPFQTTGGPINYWNQLRDYWYAEVMA
jgi:hypothetical protein